MPDRDTQEAVREFIVNEAPLTLATPSAWLLPTRSVGVGGDARSYVLPVALQGKPDWDQLVINHSAICL
jgi:hypothetical protein